MQADGEAINVGWENLCTAVAWTHQPKRKCWRDASFLWALIGRCTCYNLFYWSKFIAWV